MTFTVKKFQKRLVIFHGDIVSYIPPDFIRDNMKTRDELVILAEKMTISGHRDIDEIMKFETKLNPRE